MNEPEESRSEPTYRESLGTQVDRIEQEARMVLPGIQTLFGFQLISVFSAGFKSSLLPLERGLHLGALLMVATSAILVVAPAAYHRQAQHRISKHFVALSGRYLAWAMVPLALGTCLDIYLVANIILDSMTWATVAASMIFVLYAWTWFLFPRISARQIVKN